MVWQRKQQQLQAIMILASLPRKITPGEKVTLACDRICHGKKVTKRPDPNLKR